MLRDVFRARWEARSFDGSANTSKPSTNVPFVLPSSTTLTWVIRPEYWCCSTKMYNVFLTIVLLHICLNLHVTDSPRPTVVMDPFKYILSGRSLYTLDFWRYKYNTATSGVYGNPFQSQSPFCLFSFGLCSFLARFLRVSRNLASLSWTLLRFNS